MAKRLLTLSWVMGFLFLLLSSVTVFGQGSETCNNMTSGITSYSYRTWTGDNGFSWTASDARTDQSLTGKAVTIRNGSFWAGTGTTSPSLYSISGGIGSITASTQLEYSGSAGVFTVLVNGSSVGTLPYSGTIGATTTTTISNINVSGSFTLQIVNTNGQRVSLDDISWTGYAGASAPEINVRQGVTQLDNTTGVFNFGNQTVSSSSASTSFVIENLGAANLSLTGTPKVAISGANAADFAINQTATSSSVGAGSQTLFNVVFTPSGSGVRTATISIANDDSDENPYTFTLTGTGVAPCVAPTNQATSLNLTPAASTIDGSFTAASGGASGYLVVVSTSSTLSASPVTGVTYTAGNSLGGGTVVDGASGTTFTATGLSPNTLYYLFVFAYNNTSCSGGPVYKTPSLTNSATTLNAPVTVATYTFTGAAGNEATFPADVPQPTGVNAGVVDRQGIVSAVTAANAFGSANFQTSGGNIDLSRYVDFTIAPTAGYTLTLTDISFKDQVSGTGPSGFAVRSSTDGYASNIFSGSTNGSLSDPAHASTLTGFTNLSSGTTFRIYAYGASSGSGTWRIDDLTILGFINAAGPTLIVNPTSLAFGNQNINTTSTQQSFDVTGLNLTNNVVLSVPAGYQFSTTSGGPYTSSNITLTPAQAAATTTIYVVFKPTVATSYPASITMTSTGVTTPPSVALTGTGIVPPPTIVTSVGSLTAFGNVDVNTTSSQQSYTVSGSNLTANLVVTAPTNFGISTTSGGPYTSSLSFTPSSGTVATQTIYVVYQPTANGTQSGNITNASTGATTQNVAVSGTGVTQCTAPLNQATNLTFPSIVGTTIDGSFTASVGGADGYLVIMSANATLGNGPTDGVAYTVGSNFGGGTVVSNNGSTTFTAYGNPTTQYYFFIYAFNNTGCVNGPVYKKPYLYGTATTLTSPYANLDDFNRADNDAVGNGWTESESNSHIIRVSGSKLYAWRDASIGGTNASEWLYQDVSPLYPTTYSNATSKLEWVFNMRSTRTGPSGFASGNYGVAFVIGSTDANVSTGSGDGYAVILGNSGSPDPLQLVRFTNGLNNNANVVNSIVSWNHSDDDAFYSIKVTYDPATDEWQMFARNDGSIDFADPTTLTSSDLKGSGTDATLENSDLRYLGCLWVRASGGTSFNEWAEFDNIWRPTAVACTNNTWTGAVSTNWFDAANWSCGVVPTAIDDVVIPNVSSTTNRFPLIDAGLSTTAAVHDLTINAGASVTVTATVIAGFPQSTNDLEVYGNLTNNGNANWGTGTVIFKGSATQTIGGNNNFQYLTLDNAAGLTLVSGTQKVYGTLALKAGNVATNNRLVIGSNATYTGLVDEFSAGYSGGITGSLTVERYANNTASSFFYIGAPVGGAVIAGWADDFSLATMNGATNGSQVIPTATCSPTALEAGSPYGGLFDYREDQVNTCNLEGWHVRTTGSIFQGQGFIGRVPAGTTIDLSGTFVTGQTIVGPALTKTVNASGSPAGMNLVANPFAAPIDWQAVAAANSSSVMGTAYFYQTSGPLAGTYVPVNNVLGGKEIGSSQAFIVEAVSNGATMSFTDNMKRNGANQYLRNGAAYDQLLTLDVTGNGFADRAHIAFGTDFTTAFDSEFDARKLMSKPEQPSLYVNDGSLLYSIYAQPSVAAVQVVPVDFKAGTNGTFTIDADLNAFDPTALVFLEDRLLGTMTNLQMVNSYTFSATVNDAANRFALHFYPGMEVVTNDATCAGNDGNITFNQPGATEWALELVDANGTVVYTDANFNGNFILSNVAPSIYTLNLVHASGYTVSKLYLVNGPAPIVAGFTAPAIATEGDDVVFANTAVNATSYFWSFGDGATSTDANPTHVYAFPGEYLVELVVSNGTCQESITQLVTVEAKLANGVEGLLGGKVKIYAYGTDVTIVLTNMENYSTVEVLDLMGRVVVANSQLGFVNGTFVVNMENAANGYYFVRLHNAQDTIIKKVFVNSVK